MRKEIALHGLDLCLAKGSGLPHMFVKINIILLLKRRNLKDRKNSKKESNRQANAKMTRKRKLCKSSRKEKKEHTPGT